MNNIERAGIQLSLAKGTIFRVSLYTGSVTFRKRLITTESRSPIMSVRISLPRIIHMKNERV
jgi:hypothetical protein